MSKYIGLEFQRPWNITKVIAKRNTEYGTLYQVEEIHIIEKNKDNTTLLTESQINEALGNQEYIINLNKEFVNEHIESKRKAEIKRIKELEDQIEYENVYGYLDNVTPLQKGKILKVLNVKAFYNDNGIFLGHWTRKKFLYEMIKKGYTLEHEINITYWNKKLEEKTKANEYRLVSPIDNDYYEITKTEFDYTNYLINNVIDKVA